MADLRDERRACALLDHVLDLVLEHEPPSHAALLEVARATAPDEQHVAYRFTREGGAAVPQDARDDAEAIAREARKIGGDLMLGTVSAHSVTAVVKLATR